MVRALVIAALLGLALAVALLVSASRSYEERSARTTGPVNAPPPATVDSSTHSRGPARLGPPVDADRAGRAGNRRRGIRWRNSVAVGLPEAGSLVRGVRLPAEGGHYFTWDPIETRRPNRGWRRWGTDDLVRTTLRVIRAYARAHPSAPRVGIGDLSRPHGGDFGPRFGGIGHATHQNGLDVDVYYPLRSGAERAPLSVAEIDLRLAQELVDRFVDAGAVRVYVGPNTGLTGTPGVVQVIPNHDNHLHVRIAG